jgi:3-oxoacyl-[acyl-carrier protein] reductase
MESMSKRRVVIVTGASSGLGAAVARLFAAQGDAVLLTARRAERLRAIADEINHSAKSEDAALWLAGDAAQQETAEAVVALALERFGRVDVLVNNAGLGRYSALVDTTAEQYDELMDANVRSGFVFSRAVVPQMIAQEGGTIVFVSSVAGLAGAPNEAVYCATKFAQVGMAQALDAELRKHGIKVQAICPGGMKTEFALGHGRDAETVSHSRMMDPAEVAETVVFACGLPANVRIPSMTVRHMG